LPRISIVRRVPVPGCRCDKKSAGISTAGYRNAAHDLIFARDGRNVLMRICTDADCNRWLSSTSTAAKFSWSTMTS
jgi:hypothetical protein